jgi:hypothetical protein
MKFINIFLLFLLITTLNSCKTIEKKSQEAVNKENKKLSKFIQKSESELKINMGEPDEVIYDNSGSKFFIYTKKKYTITCERKFEIDRSNTIIAFTSKGCF